MRTSFVALVLILAALVVSEGHAQPIVTDSRIKTFVYNENEVFNVTTHYGYQANVEFGTKEEIETVSVGDRVAWQIVPAGRRLFIRAMEENAHTNMTIITSKRAYQFDLRSSASDAVYGSEELTYVVRFFYPEEGGLPPTPIVMPSRQPAATSYFSSYGAAPAAPVFSAPLPPVTAAPAPTYAQPMQQSYAQPMSQPVTPPPAYPQPSYAPPVQQHSYNYAPPAAPAYTPPPQQHPHPATLPSPQLLDRQAAAPAPISSAPYSAPAATSSTSMNYRYTYTGPNEIAPVKIYDDGRATYFKFRDTNRLPRVAIINARGEEIEVPYQLNAEGLAVVNAIAPRFSLRNNGSEVVVYNEAQVAG